VACTFGLTTPRSIPLTVGDALGADQNSTGSMTWQRAHRMDEPDDRRVSGTRPGTVAKHVSDACADLKKALPDLAIVDDPDGDPAGGEEAR